MLSYKPITVLMALYKAGEYIEAKIKNISMQTVFDDCQFIILNCLNLHNEKSKYLEFVENHNNVHVIEYDQYKTLYESWNDGISITQSNFICNSNVDDMWHPSYLEKCYKHLVDNPGVACVSSYVLYTEIPNQYDNSRWSQYYRYISDIYPLSTAGPCPFWRRSLHDQYGLFEDYLTISDACMWEKWLAGGNKFDHIAEDLVLYCARSDSLERRIDESTSRSYQEIDRKKREAKSQQD